jgi:FKBP-type peptidyl-prolyl cis-trans isomerase
LVLEEGENMKPRTRLILAAALVFSSVMGTTADPSEKASGVVTTQSGLQYVDLVVGTGRQAELGDTARVHYTGWLADGTKFDSSRDRNEPFSFRIGAGRVIKGWEEGIGGMKVSGKRKLIIPPELAYGSRGAGNVIPPNATLTFEIELLDLR